MVEEIEIFLKQQVLFRSPSVRSKKFELFDSSTYSQIFQRSLKNYGEIISQLSLIKIESVEIFANFFFDLGSIFLNCDRAKT